MTSVLTLPPIIYGRKRCQLSAHSDNGLKEMRTTNLKRYWVEPYVVKIPVLNIPFP
jgi:hypothetical protein